MLMPSVTCRQVFPVCVCRVGGLFKSWSADLLICRRFGAALPAAAPQTPTRALPLDRSGSPVIEAKHAPSSPSRDAQVWTVTSVLSPRGSRADVQPRVGPLWWFGWFAAARASSTCAVGTVRVRARPPSWSSGCPVCAEAASWAWGSCPWTAGWVTCPALCGTSRWTRWPSQVGLRTPQPQPSLENNNDNSNNYGWHVF